MLRLFSFLLLVFVFSNSAHGQTELQPQKKWRPDSTHTPKKAALLSAIFPGAGQAYNHRYWKMPLVYGAMCTSVYFIIDNHKNYTKFRTAYLDRLDSATVHTGTEFEIYPENGLRTISDAYLRRKDLSFIITGIFYVVQIVDATVDAHFLHFDVGNDLSLQAMPEYHPSAGTTQASTMGLRLMLKF